VPPFTEIRFSSPDGLNLYARDYPAQNGQAKCPIICLHGLTRNSADFEDLAPWIASLGRRVLAVDVRGRGRSDYDENIKNYQPMVYARDVIKLMHDLGIARAVFIGTSMGGVITMLLALRHLNLIAAVILNDIGPAVSQNGLKRIAAYAGNGQAVTSWEAAAAYVKSILESSFPDNTKEDWLKWAYRTFATNPQGKLQLQYDPNIAKPFKKGKIKSSSLILKFAFRRLARKRPTLLIHGALSDLIEAEQVSAMHAAAPKLQSAKVPRVGHAPMLMEVESQHAIQKFLMEVA
jgi:pimeloyl-ACP methyl ester carboxylesterase